MSKKKENGAGEIQRLDALIAKERTVISDLEAKVNNIKREKAEAEKVQAELAYQAETGNDLQARKELEQAEEILAKADRRVASLEIALVKANEKLASLEAEKVEAFRRAKRREYVAEYEELVSDNAEMLEDALVTMENARNSIMERIKKLNALAFQAGVDGSRIHNQVVTNFRHVIEQRCQFQSTWMTPQAKEIFRQRVPAVVEETFNSLIRELTNEDETATKKVA